MSKSDVSICDTGCNELAVAGDMDKGRTIGIDEEAPAFGRESVCLFPGIPE